MMTDIEKYPRSKLEYYRKQTKEKFDKVRGSWIDCGKWALPYRTKWLQSQTEGERNNHHVVDSTHTLALRSYVAGFLEGNTSASRPWARFGTGDRERDLFPKNHEWLDNFSRLVFRTLENSNFYDAAAMFYYDFGTFNTGAHYIDEKNDGTLFFHTLVPGSYYILNDGEGRAICMVREFEMTVKAIVDYYGKKKDGQWDWDNFSPGLRKMYEDSNYSQMVDLVHVTMKNEHFDPNNEVSGANRQWVSLTYEMGGLEGQYAQDSDSYGASYIDGQGEEKYLKISHSKRKPFIVGKSQTNGNYEYGEKGPTLDALGIIKSLNKKAIGKDQALDQMLRPALQGPANLRKSYITTNSNAYVPLDPASLSQKGLRPVFEVNPAIGAITQDVEDLRRQVDKHYFADFLLYLSNNPKTRTATETDAIVAEQQLVIGPNLQSLNWTYNIPVMEFIMDYVINENPYLPEIPEELQGEFLKPEFISVFAQAQRAADLPSIDRYIAMVTQVGSIDPRILQKANLDKLADLYEDRLYLPHGLNRAQGEVDVMRQQAQAEAQRQQQMEQMQQMAGAAKDVGLQVPQQQPQGEPSEQV